MTNDETDITMALPWSIVSSSSDRRHEDMNDGDDDGDDTDDDDTDDDTDDDHDDDTDDDNDHKSDSYTAAGAVLVLAFLIPSPGSQFRTLGTSQLLQEGIFDHRRMPCHLRLQ